MIASNLPIAIARPIMNPPIATSGEHVPMGNAGCIEGLQRGFALVAERLDELSEFAQRVPVPVND